MGNKIKLITYNYVTEPENIIDILYDDEDFKDFLEEFEIEELQNSLPIWEKLELYEHCQMIQDCIVSKKIMNELYP